MAATLVREPFHRAGWVYEEKLDGAEHLSRLHACWRRRS
jgi:hypothetical protein